MTLASNPRRRQSPGGREHSPPIGDIASEVEEGSEYLAVLELEVGFDGMLPDPVIEADLVQRLQRMDRSHRCMAHLAHRLAFGTDDEIRLNAERILMRMSTEPGEKSPGERP
jgi:hypothetical protein